MIFTRKKRVKPSSNNTRSDSMKPDRVQGWAGDDTNKTSRNDAVIAFRSKKRWGTLRTNNEGKKINRIKETREMCGERGLRQRVAMRSETDAQDK